MQKLLIDVMERLQISEPSPNTNTAILFSPNYDEMKLNKLLSVIKKYQDKLNGYNQKLISMQTEGIFFLLYF